jgi:hypothetical protein
MAASSSSLDLIVKFGKRALSLSLSTDETIGTLKATLEDLTRGCKEAEVDRRACLSRRWHAAS